MIVVDTNVIVYFVLSYEDWHISREVFARDSHWVAPYLWRSEFRNALMGYYRTGQMSIDDVLVAVEEGESLMQGNECGVESSRVLTIASLSGCSAYDSEFVSVAERLGVPLISADSKILAAFPGIAMSMEDFARDGE